jgi:hypothetical protein
VSVPLAPTAASSFQLLWDSLTDLIGISATATLVRRAAKHAEPMTPSLSQLVITKSAFDYQFVVPPHWNENGAEELGKLLRTLQSLLLDLTGPVVVQRLRSIPALADMLEDEHES